MILFSALNHGPLWMRAGIVCFAFRLMICSAVAQPFAPSEISSWEEERDSTISVNRRQLIELGREMERTVSHSDELQRKINGLSQDRVDLTQRLIETAERIKDSEAQMSAREERLATLGERKTALLESLAERREVLSVLISGLQKIGYNPPPTLIVKPGNALVAIRSAVVLRSVLPDLYEDARELAGELSRLLDLRSQIEVEKQRLAASSVLLRKERLHLKDLFESKREILSVTQEELAENRRKAESLAREMGSLEELIARMNEQIPPPDGNGVSSRDGRGQINPTVKFSAATGLLSLPAQGRMVTRFGQVDALGNRSRGVSVTTRQEAQVTSPADGRVVYAGRFRSYGQILIINVGEGYHIVLAGLAKIDIEPGQFVLSGEPVGVMGTGTMSGQLIIAEQSRDLPVLYVEFRKDGHSIDPTPWWSLVREDIHG